MKKKALNGENEYKGNAKDSMLDLAITNFITEKERRMEYFDLEDDSIPIMMRLDRLKASMLDHLAERWRTTRAGLACEILEKMIYEIFRKLYKDKSEDEMRQIYIQMNDDFEKRQKKTKRKK